MKRIFAAAIMAFFLCFTVSTQSSREAELRRVASQDSQSRDKSGKLITLAADEHIKRGFVYLDNRQFPEAREHFQKFLDVYPNDALLPRALFGMGRAYMWERRYTSAIPLFKRVSTEFPETKDGREALAFMGACHIRIGKNAEAAEIYQRYIAMYPVGEKIDSAYLNTIDALREAGKYADALSWVERAKTQFAGQPTAINAMQARLRMEIYRQNWNDAVAAADDLLRLSSLSGSGTNSGEIKYLKGIALENAGKRAEAMSTYPSIADANGSYFGGLATARMNKVGNRVVRTAQVTSGSSTDYPVMFRDEVLRSSRANGLDPRFVLSIMKIESSFDPSAKSPSAARGLLQLVYDTALKYNQRAGIAALSPDDLYKPSVNIAIGCQYMAELKEQFGGLNEAIAASYNGGEDNALRWLNRTKPRDPGIFTAEVGFAETKNYVSKVMTSYRIYSAMYTQDLVRK